MVDELPVTSLYRVVPPDVIGCQDSSQINSLESIIGQARAERALRFGMGIKEKGFNIYVTGMPGTGRLTSIKNFLEEIAGKEPAPFDWCYVNNFKDSSAPCVLRLPPGRAVKFQTDMTRLISSVVLGIRSSFESEEYITHRDGVMKTFQSQKHEILEKVSEEAARNSFAIRETPMGLMTIPLRKGKPITEDEFVSLTTQEQEEISKIQDKLTETLDIAIRQAKNLDKSMGEALQKVDKEVALYAIKHLMGDIKELYQDLDEILAYLDQIQEDIIENLTDFKPEQEEHPAPPFPMSQGKDHLLKRYEVNVLVDNSNNQHAPVILERNPTYNNLFGKIDQEAQFGALTTHFTLIRSGSMHRANGGYLVLPAEEVIANPLSWDSLKRALQNEDIVIEEATEKLGLISTKSLRPEPIPLKEKVILVGRPEVYQALLAYDEHFDELFKVRADFDTRMPRTDGNIHDYAAFISTLCRKENLKHLDCTAIARVIEHSSRIAEDQEKLTTHFGQIADVIREASYYASLDGLPLVTVSHIKKAIDERFYRSSLIQEQITEMMSRGAIKIDVTGMKSGQVNGLSVIGQGNFEFGQPNRITVSIGLGREGLVDIERESRLGGPIHSKGVMILSGFLTDRYAQDKPLSLSARLVFEQSYSGVEGDSASSTELYAILSALADAPIKQGIAVTGSVNQKGEVQAIGGVNEKIEGFFEICRIKGLTGDQGVMIPQSNVTNLMLNETVLSAVQEGKFHIWPIESIDQGIEVLTGIKAGNLLENGEFEEGTVNARVNHRLNELAERLASFGKPDESRAGAKPAGDSGQ